MIGELTPFLGVEIVHQRHEFRMFEAFVPKELAHMRPVLLLTVRVVVLAIGSAARPGQLHWPARQVFVQGPVEELTPIVGVEVLHRERHFGFELLQLFLDGLATLVPDGAVLRPTTEKLSKGEGINIITGRPVTAMSHGVGFY